MANGTLCGYTRQFLRVDLGSKELSRIEFEEPTLRKYLGGTGIGIKVLYDELSPNVQWNSPENRLILATGPVNGLRVMGSGTFSVVTKGALTNGATSSQASGFMGSYMKFTGFDGLVIQGSSEEWVYLYLHDGIAEIRDAGALLGKDTYETERLIKEELGSDRRGLSVFSIGPAGEKQVRFAVLSGDEGHVVAHNGIGAVMGSKRLKAVVAARGSVNSFPVSDPERVATLGGRILEDIKAHPRFSRNYTWGTSTIIKPYSEDGRLPVKNYTTNEVPENIDKFVGSYYRERFQAKPDPCWACRMHHCHTLKVTEGPYKGYAGGEPEYEQWASWGPQLGISDPGAVVMLSNEADKLGLDANEGSWMIGMVIESYEKGILTSKDTDGLAMTWGNVEAVRSMLHKIANRQGIGDILAEGVKTAAERLGGAAKDTAIYTLKGNTPRSHDDRGDWSMMLDHCTSNTGVNETIFGANPIKPKYDLNIDILSPTQVPKFVAARKGIIQFEDSLVICVLAGGPYVEPLAELVGAATGWDYTAEEALETGLRIANLLKMFNLKHGLTADMDAPSKRYGSQQVDGPVKAKAVSTVWPQMRSDYYRELGWDPQSGRPLPETLRRLGLEYTIEL